MNLVQRAVKLLHYLGQLEGVELYKLFVSAQSYFEENDNFLSKGGERKRASPKIKSRMA